MQKDLNSITNTVMDKIRNDEVKMRPRMYFILGSVLTFAGLVSSVVISVFLVGLIRFSLRSHGPMGSFRLDQMISSFPWWAPILAIIGLIAGTWLIRKYEFSFKVDIRLLIFGFILAVIVGGIVVDLIGFNDVLMRRGPMRGMMRQYMQDNGIPFNSVRGK